MSETYLWTNSLMTDLKTDQDCGCMTELDVDHTKPLLEKTKTATVTSSLDDQMDNILRTKDQPYNFPADHGNVRYRKLTHQSSDQNLYKLLDPIAGTETRIKYKLLQKEQKLNLDESSTCSSDGTSDESIDTNASTNEDYYIPVRKVTNSIPDPITIVKENNKDSRERNVRDLGEVDKQHSNSCPVNIRVRKNVKHECGNGIEFHDVAEYIDSDETENDLYLHLDKQEDGIMINDIEVNNDMVDGQALQKCAMRSFEFDEVRNAMFMNEKCVLPKDKYKLLSVSYRKNSENCEASIRKIKEDAIDSNESNSHDDSNTNIYHNVDGDINGHSDTKIKSPALKILLTPDHLPQMVSRQRSMTEANRKQHAEKFTRVLQEIQSHSQVFALFFIQDGPIFTHDLSI